MNEHNERLSAAGVNITTKAFAAKLEAAQADARKRANEASGSGQNKQAAAIIERIFNWITVVSIGLIVVLIGLIVPLMLYAEWDAVHVGLAAVGIGGVKGGVLAFVLVASVFALLFIQTQIDETRRGRYVFSFRMWLNDIRYLFGAPVDGWQAKPREHSTQYESLTVTLRVMLFALVGFSVLGRLSPLLTTDEMLTRQWLDGLAYLSETISLVMLLGAALSAVMTVALFLGLHWSLDFLATSFERLTGGLSFGAAHSDPTMMYEQLMSEWYERLITQAELKQRLTASPTPLNDNPPPLNDLHD